MIIDRVQHAGYQVNSWLIAGREEARGLLIDTGADAREILAMVRRHGVRVVAVINTHRHYDHVSGNDYLARNLDCPILAHKLERPHIAGVTEDAEIGRTFEFTGWKAEIVAIPGHTAGQIGVHVPGKAFFSADTLFKGSVGGTVAPGHSNFDDLKSSVMDQILSLPGETIIYPGHGEQTKVSVELERNPFVRVWRGVEEPGTRAARVQGKKVTIEVWAKDYDGGHKAQVRYLDGRRDVVPGSRIQKASL